MSGEAASAATVAGATRTFGLGFGLVFGFGFGWALGGFLTTVTFGFWLARRAGAGVGAGGGVGCTKD